MKVMLIAHTPEPERVVAAAAKLCYSNAHLDDLLEGLTPEKSSPAWGMKAPQNTHPLRLQSKA